MYTREFAGTLTRRLTLESPSETGGDAVVTWTVQSTVWGEMQGLGGSDSGMVASAAYRFTIRYRGDLSIGPTWRIGLSGTTRKFGISSVVDPEGLKRFMVITATEQL